MDNKILERQIKRHLGEDRINDPEMAELYKSICQTYAHYERDRKLLEHTMEINASELTEANKKLRDEAEEYRLAMNELKESLQSLQEDGESIHTEKLKNLTLVDVAKLIQQETERRKQAEKQIKMNLLNLEKKNRELDQFAYVVSHDLKAPLRAISSLAEWIEEDSAEEMTEESKRNLITLRGRVHRMENLIHGILAYSKAGKLTNIKEELNVYQLLTDIIDSLNPPAHIKVKIDFIPIMIETEVIKLQQVFGNLISNAIKYMDKPKGEISIYCNILEDCCQFAVQDNGPGIEKEYHDRIFQIFQTLSARDEVESTGIGLSIVKKIIEEQGGRIWVESKIGTGSKFVFTWPSTIKSVKNSFA